MALIAICTVGLGVLIFWIVRMRQAKAQRELEAHCIAPEALQELLAAKQDVLLLDIRQPLDLLAFPEIIPGASRIAPRELLEKRVQVLKDRDAVVYCTCASERTARSVLKRALADGYTRVRFLRGGLEAWKAKGFPVEPYVESFHLDTAS